MEQQTMTSVQFTHDANTRSINFSVDIPQFTLLILIPLFLAVLCWTQGLFLPTISLVVFSAVVACIKWMRHLFRYDVEIDLSEPTQREILEEIRHYESNH